MTWLPTFAVGAFAIAGAIAALGPILIHLLNRRRFRVVSWAAMDFLQEAIRRNRRWLRIRDLLLLALRTLAVLLVGLALARPYWSASEQRYDGTQPLHLILLIDNSLSMGYESLEGSLLDRAVQRAVALIDRLPDGSRISVLPMCGSALGHTPEAATQQNARELLRRITVADRAMQVQQAWNLVRRACEAGPPLARRAVLFSDQQRGNWTGFRGDQGTEDLPDLQVVDVSPASWQNTWVTGFRIQDGIADASTPTQFLVELRHQGSESRTGLQVTLAVDGTAVASTTVSLEPGPGVREVAFPFSFAAVAPKSGKVRPVAATVSLTADRLPGDDQRCLVVPVAAGLPIVFVDAYGSDQEDPLQNRIGETRPLRRLLAPSSSAAEAAMQPVQVRHLRIDQLDAEALRDARLVVIAGVQDDGGKTDLLRQFVQRGGRLVIAAGGQFDPERWSTDAWREGRGILPAPLREAPLGTTPLEAEGQLAPFFLDFESLAGHDYFQLAGVSDQDLQEMYTGAVFFKAIQVDLDPAPTLARPEQRATPQPDQIPPLDERPLPAARVLARFDNAEHSPFLVERQIGQGQVLFFSSGVLPEWNTLATSNAVVIFDRILRDLIRASLPTWNFATDQRLTLPIEAEQRDAMVELVRPGPPPSRELLEPSYLGPDQLGIVVTDPLTRGVYRLRALRRSASDAAPEQLWEIPLAVNGPAAESDLTAISREEFERKTQGANVRWVGGDETISLAGSQLRGQDSWWWLIVAVLGLLLIELAVLAWIRGAGRTPPLSEATGA